MITCDRHHDPAQPAPAVSIGLPVFNGEAFVEAAIRSVLDQDFGDFELIVCDNASTDRTEEICRALAAGDARIRYHRSPRNLGAAANYDRCFALARGEFFKWAAHDDALAPGYLSATVASLRAAPRAILCTTGIAEIDAQGQVLRRYANAFPGIDDPKPARRFGAVIHTRHQCEDFFGLFRRAALEGSVLHGAYNGSDRVLLAEMALRGPWVALDAPLFLHREHAGRYTRAILLKDRRAAALWQDPAARHGAAARLFHSLVYWNYLRVVRRNLRGADRMAAYAELLRWWATDDHAADVLRDALRRVPPLAAAARAARARLAGGAPPPPASRPGSLPRME